MNSKTRREVNVFNKTSSRINGIEIKKNIFYIWSKVFPSVRCGYVNFIFIGDTEIKKLNRQYLRRNRVTDVISFYYHEASHNRRIGCIEGDVFISVPQARRQAKIYGVDLSREIMLLCIHGFLHILGYRDYNNAEKKQMRVMENKLISVIKNEG